jgi:hypothetical protein
MGRGKAGEEAVGVLTGRIILSQQMSTSLGGRAIKSKVLKTGDVRHVTQ